MCKIDKNEEDILIIKVTEEMRQAASRALQGDLTDEEWEELGALQYQAEEVEAFETVEIPGQVKPGWEEVSEFLEQILTPKEEINQ